MADTPIEDVEAGNRFRNSLVSRADAVYGGAPLWHGWAIMEAFLAGVEFARKQIHANGEANREGEE